MSIMPQFKKNLTLGRRLPGRHPFLLPPKRDCGARLPRGHTVRRELCSPGSALCSPGFRQPLESPAPTPTSPGRPFPTDEVPSQMAFAFVCSICYFGVISKRRKGKRCLFFLNWNSLGEALNLGHSGSKSKMLPLPSSDPGVSTRFLQWTRQ